MSLFLDLLCTSFIQFLDDLLHVILPNHCKQQSYDYHWQNHVLPDIIIYIYTIIYLYQKHYMIPGVEPGFGKGGGGEIYGAGDSPPEAKAILCISGPKI